tara:strand:- start:2383 stop:2691 length:309 start_codon:yes stop_codon:yes gene_type:complete
LFSLEIFINLYKYKNKIILIGVLFFNLIDLYIMAKTTSVPSNGNIFRAAAAALDAWRNEMSGGAKRKRRRRRRKSRKNKRSVTKRKITRKRTRKSSKKNRRK